MSKILVDTIDTRSGTSNITIGSSNASQITLKSGATLTNFPTNTPAFMAYAPSGSQSIGSASQTKVNFSTEFFDTDGKYDNSAMRFTPTVAGKYLITAGLSFAVTGDRNYIIIFIYKNGSELLKSINRSPNVDDNGVVISGLVDLDADDYVEIYAKQNTGSNQTITGSNSDRTTFFGGFKLA